MRCGEIISQDSLGTNCKLCFTICIILRYNSTMIERIAADGIKKLLKMFPVVTVTGCRQCGKSTLLKNLLPDYKYVSLEDIDQRELASQDPRTFLSVYDNHTIIDEIQRVPSLLSYIQTRVDSLSQNGVYVLTGSHNLLLMQSISQSLAGRTALFTLAPFSITELCKSGLLPKTVDEILYKGCFPRLYDNPDLDPTIFYSSYEKTYVERDVREVKAITNLTAFSKFLRLCAGRVGQLLNITELAEAAEISRQTADDWLSVLETSYIVFRLVPYYKNVGKRLVKSPKLYFYDTGLAAYLLGIRRGSDIQNFYMRGALFENLIVADFFKQKYFTSQDPDFYFYRDNKGIEIDLLSQEFNSLKAYEIKASATMSQDFWKNINLLVKNGILKAQDTAVVYGGTSAFPASEVKGAYIPWTSL